MQIEAQKTPTHSKLQMTVDSKLSPAAQVVMDAWWSNSVGYQSGIADVLRALTKSGIAKETMIDGWVCKAIDVETILDLVAELEAK